MATINITEGALSQQEGENILNKNPNTFLNINKPVIEGGGLLEEDIFATGSKGSNLLNALGIVDAKDSAVDSRQIGISKAELDGVVPDVKDTALYHGK